MIKHSMVPHPQEFEFFEDGKCWAERLTIRIPDQWSALLGVVVFPIFEISESESSEVLILMDETQPKSGYEIELRDVCIIKASDYSGALYALISLGQLIGDGLKNATLRDWPSFSWRGVHLDVSRHFFSISTIERFLDLMMEHKLNKLHLHLNDDQGWRVEIPGKPLLTEVGSRRDSSPVGHEDDKDTNDGIEHGGFYSAAELIKLREYARVRGIEIVPEIDLPGHAQAVIAAYPELGNSKLPLDVWNRWGISEHVLNVSEAALQFAEEVVLYVANLFPESAFHIGGDECPISEWETSDQAKFVMREKGFTSVHQLQSLFTKRLTNALQGAGHLVIAWDEVLDNELPKDLVIMAWRGTEKGVQAAELGHDVVMAPMDYLYLDWANSAKASEPVAQTRPPLATTWERVYSFSVIPDALPATSHGRILGAQAQLWSEYIKDQASLDYMAFPRLCAFSETVWGTAKECSAFKIRLLAHVERHRSMNVNFREIDC